MKAHYESVTEQITKIIDEAKCLMRPIKYIELTRQQAEQFYAENTAFVHAMRIPQSHFLRSGKILFGGVELRWSSILTNALYLG